MDKILYPDYRNLVNLIAKREKLNVAWLEGQEMGDRSSGENHVRQLINESLAAMTNTPLKSKSYAFAKAIVRAVHAIQRDHREYVLSKQLLRSGTAIGALVREAEFAQSRADFIHKLSVALKETNETLYWLNLLNDTELIRLETYPQLRESCQELIALLVSSIKTLKSKPA